MANVYDYLKKYGNKSFIEKEFNDIDNIVFSALSYLNFSSIVSSKNDTVTLENAGNIYLKKYSLRQVAKLGIAQKESYKLLKKVIECDRYKNIRMSNYIYIGDEDKQFCGVKFKIKKDLIYISFEGTDHLLSGWKEDFELAYKFPTASQSYAIKYLNKHISIWDKNVIVGGHSKGGNLALVSCMYANSFYRRKIIKIYSNDGPGLRKAQIESENYKRIKDRFIHIIPDHDLVGMLLRHDNDYKIIKSSRKDVLAHSLVTWQILDDEFVEAPLSEFSKKIEKSVILWLDKHNDLEREKMIVSIFNALEKAGIYNLNDLINLKTAFRVIKNLSDIDDETKKLIGDFINFNINYLLNNFESMK